MSISNRETLEKFFGALQRKDRIPIAACYAENARFRDIAFELAGKKEIHAMWHMICNNPSLAVSNVSIGEVTANAGTASWHADYDFGEKRRKVHNEIRSNFEFGDGLIVSQHDHSNPLKWAIQALGPIKGLLAGLFAPLRQNEAKRKLANFKANNPAVY